MELATGQRGSSSLVVGEIDTARALGSGSLDVLGTPRVVALCEAATCAALEGHLEPGSTTVGTRVEIDHLRPSMLGDTVDAEATLTAVEGRRLTFAVSASDSKGPVATGVVTRVVVDIDRFLHVTP